MKTNKRLCSCTICKNVLTSNNLSIHYNSKQCQTGTLFSSFRENQDRSLKCKFCDKIGSSVNSIVQHELYCKSNPEKKVKKSSFGMLGKKGKGSNQFAKAKKLGLPIPKMSSETKEKIKEANRHKPRAYSSKEANRAIEEILNRLDGYDYGRVKSAKNNGEFFLTENRKNYYLYDLCFRDLKLIVEYQGTSYHPKNLDENFIPPYKSMGTKAEIWNKDRLKENLAKANGFDIDYIWSDNVENDINKIVEKVKKLLTEK
jgi:very-short-patch-repair endonuclease